jgi:hypothetical protein
MSAGTQTDYESARARCDELGRKREELRVRLNQFAEQERLAKNSGDQLTLNSSRSELTRLISEAESVATELQTALGTIESTYDGFWLPAYRYAERDVDPLRARIREAQAELDRVGEELERETKKAAPAVAGLNSQKNEFSKWHGEMVSRTREFVKRLGELS